jgi:hypothetical protein
MRAKLINDDAQKTFALVDKRHRKISGSQTNQPAEQASHPS